MPEIPTDDGGGWARTDIDRLALGRMQRHGIVPSGEASKRDWFRRVHIDLVGLPPTHEQTRNFLSDFSDGAHARVVDNLLDSSHFGERWARFWLDVARFADTKGYVFREDRNYPDAFTYRDWVIRALNADMPYDRFLVCQLAADQLPEDEQRDAFAAMGYLTLGRRFINNVHDIINDRIDVVSRGMLGLTVGCARCHDHKYDPIPTEDYYSLYGIFANSREPKDAPSPLRLVDVEHPRDARVFRRGNPRNPGRVVPRRFLAVLSGDKQTTFVTGSGRLELARAVASADNPLTARVLVNRVWLRLFGSGLVTTPSDFGVRSRAPRQPEVLDYLAIRFVEEGWSIKTLIRRIVLSSLYRQSSDVRKGPAKVDPDNELFWRMRRKRLDFEAMRDSILATSGQLDRTVGGASVDIVSTPTQPRRTLYGFIDRQNLPGMFRTFDFASPDTHSPKRYETTVPQQGLFLLNSPFILEQADHLVADIGISTAGGAFDVEGVRRLYRRVLLRDPSDEETRAALEFLRLGEPDEPPHLSAWTYGYGWHDEGRGVTFHRLPHATKEAWQGGAKLPDPVLGWVTLSAKGGHPGDDQRHAAIRRWTSPRAGDVTIRVRLEHPSEKGDGVRLQLVSKRGGLIHEAVAKKSSHAETIRELSVSPGETLDFVLDCREHPSFDSFRCRVDIRLEGEDGLERWSSAECFRLAETAPLGAWQRLAQVLWLTNEFLFVD